MNSRSIWLIIATAALTLAAASCKKKEQTPDEPAGGVGNILISATVKNADGASGQTYLRLIPALSGEYDNSNSIQVGFSASFSIVDNDVYVFPEFGPSGKQAITKYSHSDRGLTQVCELPIAPGSYPVNLTKVTPEKLYITNYLLGAITIADANSFTKIGEIDLTPYAHSDKSPDASRGILRDGLYYLTLNQNDASWMPYEDHRQVDVAIIDPKTDQVTKIISEKESGLCFPTRPITKDMIFTNEENDIYIACVGYFGYNPSYKKNGFVCIPNGKQAFDPSRSWDISNTPIEGTNWKPASIYNCVYIGKGLVAAYVAIIELNTGNPYTARNSMAVIIDLKARTIKQIKGIPYTDGHSVALEKHNGEVFFSAFGADASGVFAYNPNTSEVKQVLRAKENISFMYFF